VERGGTAFGRLVLPVYDARHLSFVCGYYCNVQDGKDSDRCETGARNASNPSMIRSGHRAKMTGHLFQTAHRS
jgi:hypothetical protein